MQGRGAYLWIEINGKKGYLAANDHDHDLNIDIDIDGAEAHGIYLSSRSKLLGGKSRWSFLASGVTPLGEYKLRATLQTAGGELIGTLPIEIIPAAEEPSQPKGAADEETGPDVRWINKAGWDPDFEAQTVGRVDQDDDSSIVWVNRDYDLLAGAVASNSLTADQVAVRADRYQFPVVCGLWLQHQKVTKMASPPEDDYQRRDLHRLAEAVLVAMDPDVDLAGSDDE